METAGFKTSKDWQDPADKLGISKASYIRECAELGDVLMEQLLQVYSWPYIKKIKAKKTLQIIIGDKK